jgi:hypothetical protein
MPVPSTVVSAATIRLELIAQMLESYAGTRQDPVPSTVGMASAIVIREMIYLLNSNDMNDAASGIGYPQEPAGSLGETAQGRTKRTVRDIMLGQGAIEKGSIKY